MHSYETTAGTKSRFFEPLSLESRRHLALLPSPWSDGRKLTHHARIALQAGEDKDSSIDVYVCMYVYVHTFTYACICVYVYAHNTIAEVSCSSSHHYCQECVDSYHE